VRGGEGISFLPCSSSRIRVYESIAILVHVIEVTVVRD
jgi:hypothetical protein